MAREITHVVEDGRCRQIVSPERLRAILDADGDSYNRPDHFGPEDEWDTTLSDEREPQQCPHCGRIMSDREHAEQGGCNDCTD